jgi:hypothetical protein
MFISKDIYKSYEVEIIDKTFEGILALQFKHKINSLIICITTCYLPPENSPWGREADLFMITYCHYVIILHVIISLYVVI